MGIGVLALVWAIEGLGAAANSGLRIAVAANFRVPFAVLGADFTKAAGIELTPVFGASGLLATQIRQGAPFDAFLSADLARPQALVDDGLAAGPVRRYARGLVALWTPGASGWPSGARSWAHRLAQSQARALRSSGGGVPASAATLAPAARQPGVRRQRSASGPLPELRCLALRLCRLGPTQGPGRAGGALLGLSAAHPSTHRPRGGAAAWRRRRSSGLFFGLHNWAKRSGAISRAWLRPCRGPAPNFLHRSRSCPQRWPRPCL